MINKEVKVNDIKNAKEEISEEVVTRNRYGNTRTSNGTVLGAVQQGQQNNFKSMNNLLSLQDNHVEEFFQYHGEMFLTALEQMMEDVIERVVSQMLAKLKLTSNGSNIIVNADSLREYEKITQENIDLDIQKLLNSAINTEVVNQRKLAKQQYLESQGFSGGGQMPTQPTAGMAIAGLTGQTQQYNQVQGAMNNGSYPIPPSEQMVMVDHIG